MKTSRALRTAGLAVAAVVGLALAAAVVSPGRLDAASEATGRWAFALAAARVGAIGLLWLRWNAVVAWLPMATEPNREYLRGRRNFYCLCLCAVEVVVVQNAGGWVWSVVG